jgi:hypothetical protein
MICNRCHHEIAGSARAELWQAGDPDTPSHRTEGAARDRSADEFT